jgi:hypothetical protein
MIPQKSFFQKILESAALFALAAWLVRTGVCMIQSVWGWLILLSVITGVIVVVIRIHKFYKGSKF